MRPVHRLFAAIALLATSITAPAEETIREFTGSRSTDTAEFEVKSPWLLEWRVSGEFTGSLAIDVALMEAGTSVHQGNVLKTKNTGNGARLFDQSGSFYFRVNSTMANWSLAVVQLTPEEAAGYTPKGEMGSF